MNASDKADAKEPAKEPSKPEQFWIYDFTVLFTADSYYKVIPDKNMTAIEKLNALSRLFIYLFLIAVIVGCPSEVILIFAICIIMLIALYLIIKKDLCTDAKIDLDTNIDSEPKFKPESKPVSESFSKANIDHLHKNYETNQEINKYTTDIVTDESCQMPTPDNPFMNVTTADLISNRTRPPACKPTNLVKKKIEKDFSYNLFDNSTDLYNWDFAQHNFYTMPSTTIPNDQTGFAKWLYQAPDTCKENPSNCLRYEDIRYSRFNPNVDRPLKPGEDRGPTAFIN